MLSETTAHLPRRTITSVWHWLTTTVIRRRFEQFRAIKDASLLLPLMASRVVRFDGHRLAAVPKAAAGSAFRKPRLAIITPSRLQRCGGETGQKMLLERAMESALAQRCELDVEITFIVGVDAGAEVPANLSNRADVVIARSGGRSQILALNAAIGLIGEDYDFVSFLEDDDQWDPHFLAWSFLALTKADFVSANQTEIDEAGSPLTISDFPTPSGWLMPVRTLQTVGAIDPASKWHYDADWLGRLGVSGLRRAHLVERQAPLVRPDRGGRGGLYCLFRYTGPRFKIYHHGMTKPLVRRLVHSGSGTTLVRSVATASSESNAEYRWIIDRYGCIPW